MFSELSSNPIPYLVVCWYRAAVLSREESTYSFSIVCIWQPYHNSHGYRGMCGQALLNLQGIYVLATYKVASSLAQHGIEAAMQLLTWYQELCLPLMMMSLNRPVILQ